MTRRGSARLAGFMFLFYIASAFPQIFLYGGATKGDTPADKLATIAQHVPQMRIAAVLSFVTFVDAVLLGVALYGVTRDEDHELALVALSCRLGEAVINALSVVGVLALLTVATTSPGDAAGASAVGAYLLKAISLGVLVSSTCFAVGSTVFAYLFLRARTIPAWLAWTGTVGSALLVIMLVLQIGGIRLGVAGDIVWLPVAVFEIVLGVLLLFGRLDGSWGVGPFSGTMATSPASRGNAG